MVDTTSSFMLKTAVCSVIFVNNETDYILNIEYI